MAQRYLHMRKNAPQRHLVMTIPEKKKIRPRPRTAQAVQKPSGALEAPIVSIRPRPRPAQTQQALPPQAQTIQRPSGVLTAPPTVAPVHPTLRPLSPPVEPFQDDGFVQSAAPIRPSLPSLQPSRVPSPTPPTDLVARHGLSVVEFNRRKLQEKFFQSKFFLNRRERGLSRGPEGRRRTAFGDFMENRKLEQQQASLTEAERFKQQQEITSKRTDVNATIITTLLDNANKRYQMALDRLLKLRLQDIIDDKEFSKQEAQHKHEMDLTEARITGREAVSDATNKRIVSQGELGRDSAEGIAKASSASAEARNAAAIKGRRNVAEISAKARIEAARLGVRPPTNRDNPYFNAVSEALNKWLAKEKLGAGTAATKAKEQYELVLEKYHSVQDDPLDAFGND